MHLLQKSAEARLKAHPRAFKHFEIRKALYISIAKEAKILCSKFERADTSMNRVFIVRQMIYEIDSDIFGLERAGFPAIELADIYARMIVEHEG